MIDIDNIKGVSDTEFEIAGAQFRINKLKGIAGFKLLEKVRRSFADIELTGAGTNSDMTPDERGGAVGASIIKALAGISEESVEYILASVSDSMDVKLPNTDRFVGVTGVKSALEDLISPIDYYEILVRGLAVNFMESIIALMNRLGLDQVAEQD